MTLPSGRPRITDDTPGPTLAVLAICSAATSAIVAGSAVAWQLRHRHLAHTSTSDLPWNLMFGLALAASLAQSIVTAVQVQYGLGYNIRLLSSEDMVTFAKLEYAGNLLYVGSLLLLKTVQFMLQVVTTTEKPNYWIPSGIMAGMVAFFLAAAFGCTSMFWHLRGGMCINQTAFWICFGLFDILTDVYSVTSVIWTTRNLNLHSNNKMKLLTILASKFLPVICAISRLPLIPAAFNSTNYTIALYELGIPTQIQLHLSVMTLSLGKVFRFLSFLNVGYLSSSIEPTQGKGSVSQSRTGAYVLSSKGSAPSGRNTRKVSIGDDESSKNLVSLKHGRPLSESETFPLEEFRRGNRPSQGSDSADEPGENQILVTTRIEVRSEDVPRGGSGRQGVW